MSLTSVLLVGMTDSFHGISGSLPSAAFCYIRINWGYALTADLSTTVRRVNLVTYVALLARAGYYRFIVLVVEPAVGGWCAYSV